ncbi:MAG: hypothetical protein IPK83_19220 [Planctomycetes bacterium]|nr:hypothetical protein [Planctomycetota bacterium]
MAADQAALEKLRRESERELDAERERLRIREHEIQEETAKYKDQLEREQEEREMDAMDELRRRIESEMSDRLAELSRKEADVEARCAARLLEVERDIDERLGQLESELRVRREKTEAGLSERNEVIEREINETRSRLDQQIEDIRRRQSAVAEEELLLRRRRQEVETERERIEMDRKALAAEGRGHIDGSDTTTVELSELDAADLDALDSASMDEMLGTHDPAQQVGTLAVKHAESESDSSARQVDRPLVTPSSRRFRPVPTGICSIVVGALAAAFYMWSPSDQTTVRGRLALNSSGVDATMTSAQHVAGIVGDRAVFETASAEAGRDLWKLYLSGVVGVQPSNDDNAVELTARVAPSEQAAAEAWLAAIGRAYQKRLEHMEFSADQRRAALDEAQGRYDTLVVQRDQAMEQLRHLQEDVDRENLQNGGNVREDQETLNRRTAEAEGALNAATTELQRHQSEGVPTSPVVPSEAQIAKAVAADRDLTLAIEERGAKAIRFHDALVSAVSKSQVPLTTLLKCVAEFSGEVEKQIAKQSDTEIRKELEQVALDLSDLKDHADEFTQSWDELSPKIAAWKSKENSEQLLELSKTSRDPGSRFPYKVQSSVRGSHQGGR